MTTVRKHLRFCFCVPVTGCVGDHCIPGTAVSSMATFKNSRAMLNLTPKSSFFISRVWRCETSRPDDTKRNADDHLLGNLTFIHISLIFYSSQFQKICHCCPAPVAKHGSISYYDLHCVQTVSRRPQLQYFQLTLLAKLSPESL